MKLCEAFASRLTELLAERNISLYKFCVNSGIGRSTLINLSKGDSKSPTLWELLRKNSFLPNCLIPAISILNKKPFARKVFY